jgi:DNA (cytosine-5)-methyltransferase 1
MCSLGYEYEIVYLNSMFTGMVPQSRDRMYVVFWQRGVRRPNLKLTPPAWCPACERIVEARQMFKSGGKHPGWGRYGAQYLYHCPDCYGVSLPGALPASSAIDWSIPATRIGDRARPLAKNTRARIARGLERLSTQPFAIRLLQGGAPRPTTLPLVTLTARHDMGVVLPVAGNTYERTPGNRARRAELAPFPTVHGTAEQALVVPNRANNVPQLAHREPSAPILTGGTMAMVYADRANTIPRPAQTEPAHGVCAGANHLGVVVSNYGTSNPKRPASDGGWARRADLHPIGTVTATDGHALVVPYYSQSECSVAQRTPSPTLTTVDRVGLAWGDEDIDNCLFRMFDLGEIARTMAMHLHTDGSEYVVTGNKRERMAQYGNGVTPPAMRFLVGRLQEVLAA